MRLYLHFLVHSDGHPVYLPLWGERRSARWLEGLLANAAPTAGPPATQRISKAESE